MLKDRLLSPKEIQAIFKCGKRQVYDLLHIPGFPAMKIGRKYLVSAKALEDWIQKNSGKQIFK